MLLNLRLARPRHICHMCRLQPMSVGNLCSLKLNEDDSSSAFEDARMFGPVFWGRHRSRTSQRRTDQAVTSSDLERIRLGLKLVTEFAGWRRV